MHSGTEKHRTSVAVLGTEKRSWNRITFYAIFRGSLFFDRIGT